MILPLLVFPDATGAMVICRGCLGRVFLCRMSFRSRILHKDWFVACHLCRLGHYPSQMTLMSPAIFMSHFSGYNKLSKSAVRMAVAPLVSELYSFKVWNKFSKDTRPENVFFRA